MAIRYYFHLIDESQILGDPVGVEVGQLAEVESVAIEMVREFRVEEAHRIDELHDWKLAVSDSDGNIVIILPLFPSGS